MSSYDAWLEAPYQEAARDEDAFLEWCEAEDRDPETTTWDEFQEAMEEEAEAQAEAMAEARAEDRAMAAAEGW